MPCDHDCRFGVALIYAAATFDPWRMAYGAASAAMPGRSSRLQRFVTSGAGMNVNVKIQRRKFDIYREPPPIERDAGNRDDSFLFSREPMVHVGASSFSPSC